MNSYSRKHLANSTLTHSLHSHVRGEITNTAEVLADIAEFDERKLYAEAGYSSMFAYCLGELPYCEQATYKRIRAARSARRFPLIFELVADGRLHLTAVVLLTPHLVPENFDELLAAATRKSKSQIERLLAERFPQPDLVTLVRAVPTARPAGESVSLELSPGTVDASAQESARASETQLSPGTVQPPRPRSKVTPLAPRRFGLQLTMDQETHDLLREAQDLLSHQVPSRDVADVLRHVLQVALPQLRKRKFAATSKPRRSPIHASARSNTRHVPAAIQRAVWERDAGRCTYDVSASGHRCEERGSVEFDHIDPVARGGPATLSNLRLLCRAHNQYAAERIYGPELMRRRRPT